MFMIPGLFVLVVASISLDTRKRWIEKKALAQEDQIEEQEGESNDDSTH